jgi:hypothetical protein
MIQEILQLSKKIVVFKSAVHKSMHHHAIQIIQPTRCNSFTSLFLDVYLRLNMFRASPRPSSGAYNCTRSLCFYRWRKAAKASLATVWQTCQTMTNNAPAAFPMVKTEAPIAVVRS